MTSYNAVEADEDWGAMNDMGYPDQPHWEAPGWEPEENEYHAKSAREGGQLNEKQLYLREQHWWQCVKY